MFTVRFNNHLNFIDAKLPEPMQLVLLPVPMTLERRKPEALCL